ncbi:MAG: cytochrome c oxidase assembly protein [Gammaproteobacteria bacterium]|jgi:cytochrome c oxidase assembly protein subunit 11
MKTISKKTAFLHAAIVIGMFGFGFALVPLYSVFCKVTGLNGKTGRVEAVETAQMVADTTRLITVEFVTTLNREMPWDFRPDVPTMQVHPGKIYSTRFYAHNRTGREVIGQAVPSVSPGLAAEYFNKTDCFCFSRQMFKPGEGRYMPVSFVIDPNIPKNVRRVSLSYTFFDVTDT